MRPVLRFLLGFLAAGALATLGQWGITQKHAQASHPVDPDPPRLADIHPNSGGLTWYSWCTEDPPIELVWAWGGIVSDVRAIADGGESWIAAQCIGVTCPRAATMV